MSPSTLTYGERAKRHPNPAAKSLLETIERKQSNLCVSVDVTSSSEFLSVIDVVGPYVCLIKVSHIATNILLKLMRGHLDTRGYHP